MGLGGWVTVTAATQGIHVYPIAVATPRRFQNITFLKLKVIHFWLEEQNMPQYRKIQETVTAEQWNRTGDLTGDKPLVNGEGRIVGNYKRKEVHDNAPCIHCKHPMRAHGWIGALLPQDAAFRPVDPVTGKSSAVVVAPAPEFPQTFSKAGTADIVVNNKEEAKKAVADGFKLVPKAPAPEVKYVDAAPADADFPDDLRDTDPNDPNGPHPAPHGANDPIYNAKYPHGRRRGGLVVCPGDYVVTYSNGEMETCPAHLFHSQYAKVNPNETVPFTSAPKRP